MEQLIVSRRAGRADILVVLEDPSGARRRERLPSSQSDLGRAVEILARHLAWRGDVSGVASKLRVRVEQGDELRLRDDLADRFRRALAAALVAVEDG